MVYDFNYKLTEFFSELQKIICEYENSGKSSAHIVIAQVISLFNHSFDNKESKNDIFKFLDGDIKLNNVVVKDIEIIDDFFSKDEVRFFIDAFTKLRLNDFVLDSGVSIDIEDKLKAHEYLIFLEKLADYTERYYKVHCNSNGGFCNIYLEPSDDEIASCENKAKYSVVCFLEDAFDVNSRKVDIDQDGVYSFFKNNKDVIFLVLIVAIISIYFSGLITEHVSAMAIAATVVSCVYTAFSLYDILHPYFKSEVKPEIHRVDTKIEPIHSTLVTEKNCRSSYHDMLQQQGLIELNSLDEEESVVLA